MQKSTSRIFFILALVTFLTFVVLSILDNHEMAGWLLVSSFVLVAIGLRSYKLLKGYSYPMIIFAAVTMGMYSPQYFTIIGGWDTKKMITPLLQVIMFGMGTALSLQDFGRVIKMPKGVFVGLLCQFTIMPFVGWGVAHMFSFPSEIAAGIILIGCCPSGLASNVISYLAKANLALSVTLTAFATLLAPLLTPFFMNMLAGEFIETDYLKMMLDITKVVILPIGVGLIFHHLLQSKFKVLDDIMPLISMAGIAVILLITISHGQQHLIEVGLLLLLAVFIHNMVGYFLGYGASKLFKMSEQDCRTIAIEVGMQNGGLATSIADQTLHKLSTMGLAPTLFGSLMNVTGATLALWWRSKPLKDEGTLPNEPIGQD